MKSITVGRGIFPLFFLLSFFSSCVTLVPMYDPALDEQITKAAAKNDKLYQDLLAAKPEERAFIIFESRYKEIEDEILSIQRKNEVRQKNASMLAIIKEINQKFQQYKTEHQQDTNLQNGEILSYQSYMKALWDPLILAERGLKRAS